MQKAFFGIVVLSMLLAMLTGCGEADENKSDSGSSSNTAAVTDETDATQSDSADVAEGQGTDTASTATSSDNSAKSSSYEEALRELFNAMNRNDFEKAVGLMYPDKVAEGTVALAEPGSSLERIFDLSNADAACEITEIVEERAISDEVLEQLTDSFDQIIAMAELTEAYGDELKSMSSEQREKLYKSKLDTYSKSGGRLYTITEGYELTVRYLQNGKTEEDFYCAYYIQGEGWKFDKSMIRYIRKSKQRVADVQAKSLFTACNAVFTDISVNRADVKGTYLIGSDDSRNADVPSVVNVKTVRKSFEDKCDNLTDYDYFVLVKDGVCVYSAIYKKDKTGYCGTYPLSSVPKSMNGHSLETDSIKTQDNYTLDDLYAYAKKVGNESTE